MANFNKVILAGNLTRDPELRYTPKGMAIAKFGLAINRTWKSETGETKEEVTFVDVDSFGKQAELIGQYFRKGKPILMEGRLRLDTWDDKQTNQKRSKLAIVLESFQFIDSNRPGDGGAMGPSASSRPSRPPVAAPPEGSPESEPPPPAEDDVPF
jgi:single-strand DNA-binding protein